MTDAVTRLRDFFLEAAPPAAPATPASVAQIAVERLAVLGRPGSVEGPAATLALHAAARAGASCGLLARWGLPVRSWRMPPSRAAGRAASAMRGRGLEAIASGRLVRLEVPAAHDEARGELARAGAVIDGPVVLAFGVARDRAIDDLLREYDEIVLVGDGDDLADRLAAESLAALGPPVRVLPSLGRGALIAIAGVAAGSRSSSAGWRPEL